jgi:hypothetical protein
MICRLRQDRVRHAVEHNIGQDDYAICAVPRDRIKNRWEIGGLLHREQTQH